MTTGPDSARGSGGFAYPREIGPYRIVGELGRGGMGQVLAAVDTRSGAKLAIKLLPPARAPETRQRFEVEFQAQRRVQHPAIARVLDRGQAAHGLIYLVFERFEGEPLGERLRRGPLDPPEAVQLVLELAEGLTACHAAGVLHRDLKPENVMLTPAGPRVIDFGLALDQNQSERLTRTGALMGSPGFWAPELVGGRKHQVGPATDVYGLGALLYACLTTRAPHTAENLQDLLALSQSTLPDPPSTHAPGVDAALDRVCLACLAPAPEKRTPSAQAVAQALRGWLAQPSAPPRPGRRGWAALAGLGLLTLLVALGAWALSGERAAAPPPPPDSPWTQTLLRLAEHDDPAARLELGEALLEPSAGNPALAELGLELLAPAASAPELEPRARERARALALHFGVAANRWGRVHELSAGEGTDFARLLAAIGGRASPGPIRPALPVRGGTFATSTNAGIELRELDGRLVRTYPRPGVVTITVSSSRDSLWVLIKGPDRRALLERLDLERGTWTKEHDFGPSAYFDAWRIAVGATPGSPQVVLLHETAWFRPTPSSKWTPLEFPAYSLGAAAVCDLYGEGRESLVLGSSPLGDLQLYVLDLQSGQPRVRERHRVGAVSDLLPRLRSGRRELLVTLHTKSLWQFRKPGDPQLAAAPHPWSYRPGLLRFEVDGDRLWLVGRLTLGPDVPPTSTDRPLVAGLAVVTDPETGEDYVGLGEPNRAPSRWWRLGALTLSSQPPLAELPLPLPRSETVRTVDADGNGTLDWIAPQALLGVRAPPAPAHEPLLPAELASCAAEGLAELTLSDWLAERLPDPKRRRLVRAYQLRLQGDDAYADFAPPPPAAVLRRRGALHAAYAACEPGAAEPILAAARAFRRAGDTTRAAELLDSAPTRADPNVARAREQLALWERRETHPLAALAGGSSPFAFAPTQHDRYRIPADSRWTNSLEVTLPHEPLEVSFTLSPHTPTWATHFSVKLHGPPEFAASELLLTFGPISKDLRYRFRGGVNGARNGTWLDPGGEFTVRLVVWPEGSTTRIRAEVEAPEDQRVVWERTVASPPYWTLTLNDIQHSPARVAGTQRREPASRGAWELSELRARFTNPAPVPDPVRAAHFVWALGDRDRARALLSQAPADGGRALHLYLLGDGPPPASLLEELARNPFPLLALVEQASDTLYSPSFQQERARLVALLQQLRRSPDPLLVLVAGSLEDPRVTTEALRRARPELADAARRHAWEYVCLRGLYPQQQTKQLSQGYTSLAQEALQSFEARNPGTYPVSHFPQVLPALARRDEVSALIEVFATVFESGDPLGAWIILHRLRGVAPDVEVFELATALYLNVGLVADAIHTLSLAAERSSNPALWLALGELRGVLNYERAAHDAVNRGLAHLMTLAQRHRLLRR